jgi:hypothetical protein
MESYGSLDDLQQVCGFRTGAVHGSVVACGRFEPDGCSAALNAAS